MSKESKQAEFLANIADRIPGLIQNIANGNASAEVMLGSRRLDDGTIVELSLMARNVNERTNPHK